MTLIIKQTGFEKVMRALQRLEQTAPGALVAVAKECNRRHARTYRRRFIPRDTGRLQDSLTFESHPDREINLTRRGLIIGSRVPYARYQRHRIRNLSRDELKSIFVAPILEELREVLQGKGGG